MLLAALGVLAASSCKQEQQATEAPTSEAVPVQEKKDDGKPVPTSGPSYDETVDAINRNAQWRLDSVLIRSVLKAEPEAPCSLTAEMWKGSVHVMNQVFDAAHIDPETCEALPLPDSEAKAVSCKCRGGESCVLQTGEEPPNRESIPFFAGDAAKAEELREALVHLAAMCAAKAGTP